MTEYISLGYNCNPRIKITNEYGFSKKNGYKTGPFDLCITPFFVLCKILENNFTTFFDGLKIIEWNNGEGDRSNAGKGYSAITNKDGIIFNHEGAGHSHLFSIGKNDDFYYSRNDFKEFKIRYSKRIQNFQSKLINANNITFVYTGDYFEENNIREIIKKTYGEKIINFIKIPDYHTIGYLPEPAEITYKKIFK